MDARKYNKCRLIMSRRLTLRETCSQLGFVDELSIDYDDNNEDAEEFIPVEDGENDEKIVVNDEKDVEVFEEIDYNDIDYDDGASSDENPNADQSDKEDRLFDCIPSRSGISYTTQAIPNRRRLRNTLTQTPRAIATPQTECESFEHTITEEIMQTVLRYTNRKCREV